MLKFEATGSANSKIEYTYRILANDAVSQPIPGDQAYHNTMRHKQATWISRLK